MLLLNGKSYARNRIFFAVTAVLGFVFIAGLLLPVFASDYSFTDIPSISSGSFKSNALDEFKSIAGMLLTALRYIGAVLIVWGFMQFGFSLVGGRSEAIQSSLLIFFTGVVCFGFPAILKAIGVITDYSPS